MTRPKCALLVLAVTFAGCARAPNLLRGANNGPKTNAQIDAMIAELATLDLVNVPGPGKRDGAGGSFLHQYFESAYDGNLVDSVYFFDMRDWNEPLVRSALTRGDERPNVVAEEQNAWALTMIALPRDAQSQMVRPGHCFVVQVRHEVIVESDSPIETGLLSAALALTHLSIVPKKDPPKATDFTYLPSGCTSETYKDALPLRFVGVSSQGVALYAALSKVDLATPSTNRFVASVREIDKPASAGTVATKIAVTSTTTEARSPTSKTESKLETDVDIKSASPEPPPIAQWQQSAVTTFRNASRPRFSASAAFGERMELHGERTTNGTTRSGHLYDPDLYVLFHYKFPLDFWTRLDEATMLTEHYPSLFVGTNVLSGSVLNDLVGGLRIPILGQFGLVGGLDWSKYSYYTVPTCTAMCMTKSSHRLAGFVGFDLEL